MTALAEALLAAQRQAAQALGKAFVAGSVTDADVVHRLTAMGCTDTTDQDYLLKAWETLREFGAPAPQATKPERSENEPATERQTKYINKLAEERGVVAPDYPLTKDNASKVIEQLQAGTYVADEWSVPF